MPTHHRSLTFRRLALTLSCAAALVATARADDAPPPTAAAPAPNPAPAPARVPVPAPAAAADLTSLNIEDLMNVEVTSVSRQKQKASEAPAAVTVITSDDIHRSHFDSVPELLRLVPGMDVARLNANTWAIGSRGFNDVFENKLQVLVDGRSVYTPLFSGVFWDLQETLVQDLDRIEAIRGPGATLWGSNAVNGVINVTSKNARDTQGFLVDGQYGSFDQRAAVRYGGKIDDNTWYRAWGQFRTTDDFPTPGDNETLRASHDGWDSLVGGFRMDHVSGADDTFTLIGNAGSFREGKTTQLLLTSAPYTRNVALTSTDDGANLLGRWTHVIGDRSDFTVQAYYDHINHNIVENKYTLDTGDVEFHHRFPLGDRQEVIWGGGYRFMADGVTFGPRVFADPSHRDDYIASAFVQDDVTVVKDRVHLILGTKLEENSFSGFEAQPSARVLWTPNDRNSVWGAVSRAVRTPSRYELTGHVQTTSTPVPPTGVAALGVTQPNLGFDSEQEIAYELGHRFQANKSLSFDTAVFFNRYNHLRTFDPGTPSLVTSSFPPYLSVPITFGNKATADSYGGEVAVNWKVTDRWRLSGSYSLSIVDANLTGASSDPTTVAQLEGSAPRNQAQVHSYWDITRNLQLDASLYYVEATSYLKVPSTWRADLAVTWTPKPNLTVTVGGQNLLDRQHPEFGGITSDIQRTEVPRSIFAEVTYRY